MILYCVNESTSLAEKDVYNIAWACNYQLTYHYARSGWRTDVRCVYVPKEVGAPTPPQLAGQAVLHFLDTSDQPGALGYHDEDGTEVPSAKVFVKTAVDGGDSACEVASHEALELATDPQCTYSSLTADGSRLYALEVGDPVQGTGYDVGAPEGRTTGMTVANFALPAYFDPNAKTTKVDYRSALKAPFTLTPGGYMSYVDLGNTQQGWQQEFGSERKEAPAWASRHDQRTQQWVRTTT